MDRLLLVEDMPSDAMAAAKAAESVGFKSVQAIGSVRGAIAFLEECIEKGGPLPDAIVLDLDLGVESGFELLRFWYATPSLSKIPVLVWSIVEEQRKVCELFKIRAFVPKWDGPEALRQALAELDTPTQAG